MRQLPKHPKRGIRRWWRGKLHTRKWHSSTLTWFFFGSTFLAGIFFSAALLINSQEEVFEGVTPQDNAQKKTESVAPTRSTAAALVQQATPATSQTHDELLNLWFLSPDNKRALRNQRIPLTTQGPCPEELLHSEDFLTYVWSQFEGDKPGAATRGSLSARHHIHDASLFFTHEELFVQVRAEWLRNDPPSYRLVALSFNNPELEGSPQQIDFETFDPQATYDIDSVREIFLELQQNYATGLSTLSQSLSSYDGNTLLSAEMVGDIPLSFSSGKTQCALDRTANQADCVCAFPNTPTPH